MLVERESNYSKFLTRLWLRFEVKVWVYNYFVFLYFQFFSDIKFLLQFFIYVIEILVDFFVTFGVIFMLYFLTYPNTNDTE